jgi:hypothetical protein
MRRITRVALTFLAGTGLALGISGPAQANGTPDQTPLWAAGGGGYAEWQDYSGSTDLDDLWICDTSADGHSVWVRVEHPNGQYIKIFSGKAGNCTYWELPNLPAGYGMSVTVCLSDGSTVRSSTCKLYWVTE